MQNQSAIYSVPVADPSAEPVLLLDPNTLSADGTVALFSEAFSDDGAFMSYQLAAGGSDWRTVHVMAVDEATGRGTVLADELHFVKFSSEAWTRDGRGFFYQRYSPPGETDLGTGNGAATGQSLWYHVVGTNQALEDAGGRVGRFSVFSRVTLGAAARGGWAPRRSRPSPPQPIPDIPSFPSSPPTRWCCPFRPAPAGRWGPT